jgi:hypothetical protein
MNFDELPDGNADTGLTFDKLPDEPSFLQKAGNVAKNLVGVVSIPRRAYEEIALPFAENLTSQAVGLVDAGVTGAVAARDYLQGLAGTGSFEKAYEIAKKGAENTPKLSNLFTPSTELGKASSEISNKIWGIPGEIGEEVADLPLESAKALEYIRQPVKAVAGLAAYGGVGGVGSFAKSLVKDILKERGYVKPKSTVTSEQILNDRAALDAAEKLEASKTETSQALSFDDLPSESKVLSETLAVEPVAEAVQTVAKAEVPVESAEVKQEGYWSKPVEALPEVPVAEVKTFDALPDKVVAPETSKVDSLPEMPAKAASALLDVPESVIPETVVAKPKEVKVKATELDKLKALGYDEVTISGMSKGQRKVIISQGIEPKVKQETPINDVKSDQLRLRVALKIGEEIASSPIEGGIHAGVELPKPMQDAWDAGAKIDSGWVDQNGKWYGAEEGKALLTEQLGKEAEQRAKDATTAADVPKVSLKVRLTSPLKSESGNVQIPKQGFYSKLEEVVNAKMRANMPVAQLKKTLVNNGVTVAEVNSVLSGLKGVVSKKQVVDAIVDRGTRFEDVVLGGEGTSQMSHVAQITAGPDAGWWQVIRSDGRPLNGRWKTYEEASRIHDEMIPESEWMSKPKNPTKFESYVEPGAVEGSYREMFVTAPGKEIRSPAVRLQEYLDSLDAGVKDGSYSKADAARYAEYAKADISYADEVMDNTPDNAYGAKLNWQDGHSAYSDIQNPIVRIRFNEREVNGKKILFVEEIQGPSKSNQAKMPEALRDRIYDIGVKKVLSYAKENGFDGVSWTTGKMQADRYSLAKQLDTVNVGKNQEGYYVEGMKDGKVVITDGGKTLETLTNLIGKDLAFRAVNDLKGTENGGYKKYSGLDLEVGGEGLKRLYDETIPGLVKKYGKEGVQELQLRKKAVFEGSDPNKVEYQKTLYSPITSKTPGAYTFYSDPFGLQVAVNSIKNPEVRKLVKEIGTVADDYLGAISTRLGNIDPSIKYALRKLEYTTGRKVGRREKAVLPLIKASEKMSSTDYKLFDTARKNGDAQEIARLGEKYKITKELDTLRLILDDIYAEAKAVGLEVKYREHYHPREVADVAGLLDHLRKTEDWTTIDHVIKNKEAKLKRYLTEEEKVKVINTLLRGYSTGDGVTLTTPGQLKIRSVAKITPELEKFYANSDSALLRYISDLTTAIEMRKFFGKGSKDFQFIDLDNSIGAYVLDVMDKKKLTIAQERELTNILKARFNAVGTRGIVGLYKNLSYIDTMGSPLSAITQLGDVAFSMYKYGVSSSLKSTAKAIIGKSKITRKDLGIEKIAAEFSDKSTMAKAVDSVFNIVGLTKIDSIFKETAINSAFDSAYKKAQTEKSSLELRKDLEPIFGEETTQVLAELKEGAVTENTKLYVFNKLADLQPIALSEMPIKYLTGGNGRIFYMLKTYTLKMFDVYRNEVFSKINTPGQRVQGIKNLIKLSAYLIALNTGADSIKDLMLGRPFDLKDTVINNIYRLGGASRFLVSRGKVEGVGSAAFNIIAPPTKFIDALTKDLLSLGDEKGFEVTQSIPAFGKLYYWWFGKGAEKAAKQEKQQLKEKYYKQATKDIEKLGDISSETVKEVVEDKRLSERDKSAVEKRIEVGDELVYSVMKMPFEKALVALKYASKEDQQKLLEVLDEKYERLSEEDQVKYDPKIDEIIADIKKPKFSIRSLLSSDKES